MGSSPPSGTMGRVGYVLEQYPRFAETFVLAEIMAHEAAGQDLEIFSLRPPTDARFPEAVCRIKAPVVPLWKEQDRDGALWQVLEETSRVIPGIWAALEYAKGEVPHDVLQGLRLAVEAKQRGITHLHAHFGGAAVTVGRLAGHFAGIPYSFTAPAAETLLESAHPEELRRQMVEAAAVVTSSDHDVASLRQRLGAVTPHVRRVYRGLDLEAFPFRAPRDRPPRIVAAGSLVERRGFDELIKACALMHRKGVLFECRIIGDGPMEAELRRLIIGLGLGRSVSLLGGRPADEITRIVGQAAAFVNPAVTGSETGEGALPTVMLEAMGMGTPVLATKLGAVAEVIRHGETGILVPPKDSAKLAAGIQRLLRDPVLRVHVAVRARNLIETMFDIRRNSAELRVLFGGQTQRPGKAALSAS